MFDFLISINLHEVMVKKKKTTVLSLFIPSGNDNDDLSHFTKGFLTYCLSSLIISWGKQGRFDDLILQAGKLTPREVISCV